MHVYSNKLCDIQTINLTRNSEKNEKKILQRILRAYRLRKDWGNYQLLLYINEKKTPLLDLNIKEQTFWFSNYSELQNCLEMLYHDPP